MQPRRVRHVLSSFAILVSPVLVAACGIDTDTTAKVVESIIAPPKPDSMPRMLNAEPPFRYPTVLYDRKVQGNVTLRLFVDSTGRVWPESTLVTQSSGSAELDTAAVRGSEALRFRPAFKDGLPMNVRVAFPVFFRHPEAQALPGDTVLRQQGKG